MTDTIELRPTGTAAIVVAGVSRHAGDRQLLHGISFAVAAGEVVAIAGGSGAGKTTLLETMAGLRSPSEGAVLHHGVTVTARGAGNRVGYVPQDDIVHRDLPLRRTLRYAAGLRLTATSAQAERIVDETLCDLDLADRAAVRVADLSGGQRKRASIAVELLARPRLLFLDEPTSGLDPSTAADVMGVLRRLAGRGVTVVLTTHSTTDIDACDRVVFLARNGHLAFTGTPAEARSHFGVEHLAGVYGRLVDRASLPAWVGVDPADGAAASPAVPVPPPDGVGRFRQWALLARRSADVMVRNRLTLAVLLGSPILVTAMMATLFGDGAFGAGEAHALEATQLVFWLAFAGFFFGLTYGLLQIVGEMAVLRRERFAGLSIGAYVFAKMAVLTPLLGLVAAVLLGVLRILDRLPDLAWSTYAALFLTLLVESVAALALGLLASAAVADTAQATLALPMLCFPQVLFAGAIVPVPAMALPGRLMSYGMTDRWGFEALGRLLPVDPSRGDAALAPYASAFGGSAVTGWIVLAATAAALTAATIAVVRRRA